MNALNPYNASYSQFPNMPYRMFGLWFSGFCFALFWGLLIATAYLAKKNVNQKTAALLMVCIFGFGFLIHLPVMHRDYFYIPGFTLGYKVCVSYIGFVFLLGLLATEINWSGFARFFPRLSWLCTPPAIFSYVAASAIVRALALTLPQRFPW